MRNAAGRVANRREKLPNYAVPFRSVRPEGRHACADNSTKDGIYAAEMRSADI